MVLHPRFVALIAEHPVELRAARVGERMVHRLVVRHAAGAEVCPRRSKPAVPHAIGAVVHETEAVGRNLALQLEDRELDLVTAGVIENDGAEEGPEPRIVELAGPVQHGVTAPAHLFHLREHRIDRRRLAEMFELGRQPLPPHAVGRLADVLVVVSADVAAQLAVGAEAQGG